MTATILQFPLQRRWSPQVTRMVDVTAQRAEAMGKPCDREHLASIAQRWLHGTDDPASAERAWRYIAGTFNDDTDPARLERIRRNIAALPPRKQ